jgi:cysteine desulfurase
VNRTYFDHNATTSPSPEALEAYLRVSRDVFGNASSIHYAGQDARREIESARARVSRLLGAPTPKEIVFTSGGTESDNLALFGVMRRRGAGAHLITTTIEHPAVLQPAAQLEREGFAVSFVPVGSSGVVDPDDVRRAITPQTALISVMHVNNELGTIQPLAEIAQIAREHGITMHSDGVQAAGRLPVDVQALGVDLYSASGHKMQAPKGTGALYIRNGTALDPVIFGGRHENGRRPGTENVPGAAALGVAAANPVFLTPELRDRLEAAVLARIPDVRVNGGGSPRAANTANLLLDGVEGESLVIALDLKGFCVSSGAACSSGAVEPSHVLTAIGLSRREAKSCIRVSLGAENTSEQVDAFVDALTEVAARLRRLSPDYVVHA